MRKPFTWTCHPELRSRIDELNRLLASGLLDFVGYLGCLIGMKLMERFLVDRMLGKLAKWLRVLGYDTVYLKRAGDEEILTGLKEGRILITRNRRGHPWLKWGRVLVINANDPQEQLQQVVQQLGMQMVEAALFSRCLECNLVLTQLSKEEALGEVPDYVLQTHSEFWHCPGCRRVFWAGSHSEKMRKRLEEVFVRLR